MYTTTMRGCGTGSTRSRSTSHTSYYTHPVLTQPLTQQRTLHPATYPSSYAHFSAYQPTYDTSVMMYPSYPTYPSTTYSTFPLSQPLPIPQHISQPLQQQQLALLMQHAWMQQASCFQQSQHQQQTSLYPSVCFPSTTYYPPTSLPVLQQAPPPASAAAPVATSVRPPVLPTVHAHMHTHTQDPSWILAHPSPSESIPSSTSSSRTCSPTYHLPCTCTGCHGTCTCSHPHAPQSCTSQASIGTSVDSIPHPRSYSPPQLMLPPIMIPPSSSEVHSATIHRTRNDSDPEDTTAALASTHISDIPPLSLPTSTSTSSLSSYGSGSIRNNFETPLMIIDDDEHESPKHGRMRAMTVMGMMMAASQRSVTRPHSTRPRRLSQRMSILRPMAMSQPVSPTTRDVEAEISHDNATSTIKPSSFEPTTSLSMSLSPLHPMEWPGDDKYEYTCDDEYDKLSYDFASQQRISYHKPTFSYADVVRSKQSMQKRTTTRVPHVVSRA